MNRRAVLLAFGAAVGLLLLWFVLLWRPQGSALDDARARADTAEAEHSALELRLARLRASQENATGLMADLETLRRAVPDEPELAQFILDANDIAETSGVAFLSISPGVPSLSTDGTPPVVTLNISVRGTYDSVIDYLRLLEELPRIVVVDSVSLTPEGTDQLNVALIARMFSNTAPQVTTTTAAPTSDSTTTTAASGG